MSQAAGVEVQTTVTAPDLEGLIAAMSLAVDADTLRRVVTPESRRMAAAVARGVRRAAPRGPTGNLAKSIKGRRIRQLRPGEIAAAGVFVRSRRAPHGHLVVLGTQGPRRAKGRSMTAAAAVLGWYGAGKRKLNKAGRAALQTGGRVFVGPEVGPMPANPFVEPAVRAALPAATEAAVKGLGDRLTRLVLGGS